MAMKTGTEERTVLYVTRIDRLAGQVPMVHYVLEPVTISYCDWKVMDAGPSCSRSVEEGSIPFSEWDRFVRAKGYLDARQEWLPILMELQRKDEEWAVKQKVGA